MTSRLIKITWTASAALLLAFNAYAVEYKAIDVSKSHVAFSYKQMGVGMDGKFKKFSALMNFDPAKPAVAKATLEIDLASIDTGSGEADQEVTGKAWFNTSAFPKAVFVQPNQADRTQSI